MAAVAQVDILGNMFEQCVILGLLQSTQVRLLDPDHPNSGIEVTYQGGDPCSDVYSWASIAPRAVSFRLRCRETEEGRFRIVNMDGLEEYETCDTVFETFTAAGCPMASENSLRKAGKLLFLG